ncbi:MAG TPA: sigma-70 family RNA polymerase sigma factor [Pseudonocardia sp.]
MRSSTGLVADRPPAPTTDALTTDALTTTALVAAACRRDERAWTEIVLRYGRLVTLVVASYRMQEADAADAEANTWLHAVESLASLRDPTKLGGWLRTIARRECLATLRRTGLEEPSDLVAAGITDVEPGPEEAVIGDEVCRAIAEAMGQLPRKGRWLILALFFLPEMAYADMAEQTGMPVGSLGPTRMRALRTLRTGLEDAGFGPDALAAA